MKAKGHYSNIILGPVVTEKAHRVADAQKVIVLKVLPKASKPQIAEAVEKLFKVKVDSIRTVAIKGKVKNFGGRPGKKADIKKAYVKLQEGFDINLVGQ